MNGIQNDPQAGAGMSVQETVDWLKAVMDKNGAKTIIISREWARRLELEGFDMDLITVAEPFSYPQPKRVDRFAENHKGPRGRWGALK